MYIISFGVLGTIITKLEDNNNKYAIFEIINDVIKKWLMNNDNDLNVILNNKYDNNIYFNELFNNNINKFIFSINSPFYTRKLGNIEQKIEITDPSCKDVQLLTQHFELKGIIVGHTPQIPYGINGTCSDKLYRVDIASSKAFYYIVDNLLEAQVLVINKNKVKIIKN